MKSFKKYLPLLLLVALGISAWILGIHRYLSLDSLKEHQQMLELYIENHPMLSVFIYSSLYILVVSLSLPVATFMTLAGGFLFGQWIGTSVGVISATLGACIFFLSAKMASKDILTKKAGSWLQKMRREFQKNAFFYLLTLRLIPLFPFVAVNIVAAVLQIPFRTFFFGTFLGIIPGVFVYVSMGVALREVILRSDYQLNLLLETKILIALIGLGILSLSPVLYKHWQQSRSK